MKTWARQRISSAGTGGNGTKRDDIPRRHRTIMQSMGVPNSACK
ncbi:hypothetical protein T03_8337 [Trichinella britovi]|uniref:Uncharacterized protein n=1 Tax=Trichinella britovi TaxID=45882 RepID=A0A0V0YW31_TRIBR|nr:hypothetical protein T03_8337 [Trichinella britovi]